MTNFKPLIHALEGEIRATKQLKELEAEQPQPNDFNNKLEALQAQQHHDRIQNAKRFLQLIHAIEGTENEKDNNITTTGIKYDPDKCGS